MKKKSWIERNSFYICWSLYTLLSLVCVINAFVTIARESQEPSVQIVHSLTIVDKQTSGVFANRYFVLACDSGIFVWGVSRNDYFTHEIGDTFNASIFNYGKLGDCQNELWHKMLEMRGE